jgi:multidrug efflux pump subunit AcrB
MFDFVIASAFVAIVLTPAIVAAFHRETPHDDEA